MVFVLPLIFLVALELGLRLIGFGFDPHFFKPKSVAGKDYFEANSKYYLGQVFTESNQKYIVIVGARDRRGKTTTVYIVKILLFGGIGFILLAFFLGRFLAKRVINPVARITKEVNRISASNLHNRLPEVKNADEISDLTETFNDMLDRLETSFEIQANFINNASHELKTPITTIIAEAEIMLLKEREKEGGMEKLKGFGKSVLTK